jgi:peptidoglycan/xylan/chitin deacetylase (PgdA/CDA1 family)
MEKSIILMYHNIGLPPEGVAKRGLYVTPRMFKFQMWYLKAAGFNVVSLKEILHFAEGNERRGKLVAMTFDDGFQDFYDYAYPVLKKYNYPSTVFLVSDLVGWENTWDYKHLKVRKKLLDWERILALKDTNVVFGSHTKTHPSLTNLSREELVDEIRGSKEAIEQRLGGPVEIFCYPYGDYDAKVLDAVREAGYLCAVTTKRGYVQRGDNKFEMKRISIKLHTFPLSFLYKLHIKDTVLGGAKG